MSLENPLTFLDMCQRAQQECGAGGALMSTVAGQTGRLQQIVGWVSNAWMKFQASHQDWSFLRNSLTFPTVNGQGVYSLANCGITDPSYFGKWDKDTFRNYVTAQGIKTEVFMFPVSYDRWRDAYLYGALRDVRTRPLEFAVAPDKSIALGPIPSGDYTVVADYFIGPQPMLEDEDTPTSVIREVGTGPGGAVAVPSQWNMLFVYRAMMDYGAFIGAPEVYDRGKIGLKELTAQFSLDSLPEVTIGGALA